LQCKVLPDQVATGCAKRTPALRISHGRNGGDKATHIIRRNSDTGNALLDGLRRRAW
jgi:hypothetical protein